MSGIKSQLKSTKLAGAGQIPGGSVGIRDFLPVANNCILANMTDQYGRFSGPGALNTVTQPGCWSPQVLMLNENALRPALSSNPLYANIASDIGFGGATTMYDLAYSYQDDVNFQFDMNNDPKCSLGPDWSKYYKSPPGYVKNNRPCTNPAVLDQIPSIISGSAINNVINVRNPTNQYKFL